MEKFLAGEAADQGARVRATEDTFLGVDLDPQNFLTEPLIPLATKIFNLRELRHGAI